MLLWAHMNGVIWYSSVAIRLWQAVVVGCGWHIGQIQYYKTWSGLAVAPDGTRMQGVANICCLKRVCR